MKKIISFSLYGSDPKYIEGMKQNIDMVPKIYGDDWVVRIYVDNTVDQESLSYFKKVEGIEVVDMTNINMPGMFWRFMPFTDTTVDIFCVRDADSRPSIREKAAVDEWLASSKSLHTMRDHPHHNYVVMGGMFGFNKVNGNYNFIKDYKRFISPNYSFKKMDDMIFLKSLYENFYNSSVSHDSYARSSVDNNGNRYLTKSKNYPITRENKEEGFIGEIFNKDNKPEFHRELL